MPVFSHEFELPFPPSEAMVLFTPKGEEIWVPGWNPRYVDPPRGETREGMVFSTHDDAVWWTCLLWDPAGEARYLRLTPGVKFARVHVRCAPCGEGATQVQISYDWHAINEEGAREIAELGQEGFTHEIAKWRELILSDH